MRNHQHIIDTKAVKQTINSILDYCVIRGLDEEEDSNLTLKNAR